MSIKHIIKKIRENKDFSISSYKNLILDCGISNNWSHEQPKQHSPYFDKGIKIWQYPDQLAVFANYISNIKVSSYFEIGCNEGGTFIFISEILKQNNPNIKLYICDVLQMSETLREYQSFQDFTYLTQDSLTLKFNEYPEFVFIDGNHEYKFAKHDFDLFCDKSETKYIAFHDIYSLSCPDTTFLWSEVLNDERFNTVQFCDQYSSVEGFFMGIGLALRK